MPLAIEDYALIGDCHTAALVGRDGSIDWLCLPRFDARRLLCRTARCARARPLARCAARFNSTRQPTLPTRHANPRNGIRNCRRRVVVLIDFMPPRSREPDLVRMVRGVRGRVKMRTELIVRFDYGSIVPWVRQTGDGTGAIGGVRSSLYLDSPIELKGENLHTVGDFEVTEGEEISFVLMCSLLTSRAVPASLDADRTLEATERWWQEWSSRCQYHGPWKDLVQRSLITLKALTYAPTGGIVAAPTTSLPEMLGGVRNWDYRISWLRDATFTLYALMLAGYTGEAGAWREWLLRAVAGAPQQVNIMYGLGGERRLTELELPWLPGFMNSAPVRIGNAAWEQFQLDVFGEVCDTLHAAARLGLPLEENVWRLERAFALFLEQHWRDPDAGNLGSPRTAPAFRAFQNDGLGRIRSIDQDPFERFGAEGDVARCWRTVREEIHREVCAQGFDAQQNAFVQAYGSKELDASLLMMPLVGFLPPSDPRVRGTVEAIERHLMADGFVLRYRTHSHVDGLPPGEGAFLPCHVLVRRHSRGAGPSGRRKENLRAAGETR